MVTWTTVGVGVVVGSGWILDILQRERRFPHGKRGKINRRITNHSHTGSSMGRKSCLYGAGALERGSSCEEES